MNSSFVSIVAVALTALFFAAVTPAAHAQGVPGVDKNKCLAVKTNCVKRTLSGLLHCRASCQRNPKNCGVAQSDCEAKVMAKFDGGEEPAKGCFAKLEAKEDLGKPVTVCTTKGDAGTLEAEAEAIVAEILARLEGTPVPTPMCGDGIVNAVGEHCDGADLDGYTCASFGLPGTLQCDESCDFDISQCFDCVGSGGIEVGGSCWFWAFTQQSCDEACASACLSYDPSTKSYAGSDGTDQSCIQVLDALGAPDAEFSSGSCSLGYGCYYVPAIRPGHSPRRTRCTEPPTTSAASYFFGPRACACR